MLAVIVGCGCWVWFFLVLLLPGVATLAFRFSALVNRVVGCLSQTMLPVPPLGTHDEGVDATTNDAAASETSSSASSGCSTPFWAQSMIKDLPRNPPQANRRRDWRHFRIPLAYALPPHQLPCFMSTSTSLRMLTLVMFWLAGVCWGTPSVSGANVVVCAVAPPFPRHPFHHTHHTHARTHANNSIVNEVHSKPPPFVMIRRNQYVSTKPVRRKAESSLCICVDACGDKCLNRALRVECVGAGCEVNPATGARMESSKRRPYDTCGVGAGCGNRVMQRRKLPALQPIKVRELMYRVWFFFGGGAGPGRAGCVHVGRCCRCAAGVSPWRCVCVRLCAFGCVCVCACVWLCAFGCVCVCACVWLCAFGCVCASAGPDPRAGLGTAHRGAVEERAVCHRVCR